MNAPTGSPTTSWCSARGPNRSGRRSRVPMTRGWTCCATSPTWTASSPSSTRTPPARSSSAAATSGWRWPRRSGPAGWRPPWWSGPSTSAPDILAAGDAVETANFFTGEPVLSMLAGPANREGRIAANTIAGREDVGGYRGTLGTAVVKVFDMTAGGTGLTETELRAAGMDYRKVDTHQMGHAGYYPGTAPLFLKVLFGPAEGKLLGAQVLGWDGVDKRIDVLAVAIRAGMTVFDLEHLELAYAPPYGAAKDPVNMAGFLGANLLRGDIDLWYAEDYPDCRDKVTILDVRTPVEYDAWHISGAVLLPFTDLRQRLDEVPRGKP